LCKILQISHLEFFYAVNDFRSACSIIISGKRNRKKRKMNTPRAHGSWDKMARFIMFFSCTSFTLARVVPLEVDCPLYKRVLFLLDQNDFTQAPSSFSVLLGAALVHMYVPVCTAPPGFAAPLVATSGFHCIPQKSTTHIIPHRWGFLTALKSFL